MFVEAKGRSHSMGGSSRVDQIDLGHPRQTDGFGANSRDLVPSLDQRPTEECWASPRSTWFQSACQGLFLRGIERAERLSACGQNPNDIP